MIDKNLYTEDSIESLNPLQFTRLRPGVYCGSTEYSTQLLIEIISNSVDEFKAGHGNQIDIEIDKSNNVYTVRDYGQGFLVNSIREDGKTVLQASFDTLNTSGKFSDDGVYEGTALGLNGIGSKLTNFLSHWLKVRSYRDGQMEADSFVEGIFEGKVIKKLNDKTPSGVMVSWQPSEEFFNNPEVDLPKVKNMLHILSCLCVGLTFNLKIINGDKIISEESFSSVHGLNDLVNDAIGDDELLSSRMEMNFDNGKNKMDMVLAYTSKYSLNMISYVNTGETSAGPHITQIKTILTREFNKFFKEKKWLKEKDENLSGDDIQEGMFIAFNLTAPGVSYDAQTKSRIVKIDMSPFTTSIVNALHDWFNKNEKDIKIIFEKAAAARKARDAAKKARDKAREQNKKKQKALKFDSKLADCWSKDRMKCEIYVTEGDSASGNLKLARDNEFVAVMPVRGKILNVRKASLDKIQKNAEIMTMIDAFGLTVDMKTMKLTYNKEDLRYGKIIIESDADTDGAHIKNLFYTFIWTFCPELILDGYVYAGVPPLYKITEGKDTYIYLKNDAELEEYRADHKGKKYLVNRLKGLGEMSPDETSILVDPDQRIIKQITVEDIMAANKLFDDLMGTQILPRKRFIQQHSQEATYGN